MNTGRGRIDTDSINLRPRLSAHTGAHMMDATSIRSTMRSWACGVLTTAFALAFGAALAAHDFWIEPSTFEPAVGSALRIYLRVGERFAGDAVARDDNRIERFFASGPSGTKSIAGRHGVDPAGLMRVDAPGLWAIGYRSRPTAVTLGAEAFEAYLKEEGLERIIDERARLGERGAQGREIFSRSVKALLRVGGAAATAGSDRPLGLTLELVADRDPQAVQGGRLPLRLLFEGEPLEGALVVALHKDTAGSGEGKVAAKARTGRDGRVTIPAGPGVWLVKAVHMRRAAPGTSADWESIWTSLTFAVR
jgi:hypothetical protein